MITPCPNKAYPGLWEVGMVMWEDLRGGRCSKYMKFIFNNLKTFY